MLILALDLYYLITDYLKSRQNHGPAAAAAAAGESSSGSSPASDPTVITQTTKTVKKVTTSSAPDSQPKEEIISVTKYTDVSSAAPPTNPKAPTAAESDSPPKEAKSGGKKADSTKAPASKLPQAAGEKSKSADSSKMATPEQIKACEDGFKKLQAAADCHSLLKKYLTEEALNACKARKTKLGATLIDVIQSGVANLDSGVGVYAPDAEAYTLFKELFNPLIEDYHNGFKATDTQPPIDLGADKIDQLPDLDPEGKYINSTRIRCGRSLEGYPFNPCLTEANYLEMETKVKAVFDGISDPELKGKYHPLAGMTKEVQNQLIADHFLFKEGDRFLQEANACRYWPAGRGIFHNDKKTFLVWCNEEDHLRIISMQPGGNVGQVLDRLIKGANAIASKVPFSRDDRLGWLTFCPSNLGTTVRASVHVKLPKTSARPDFKKICDDMKLQIRGIHGEHSESAGGVYDISNKARLGLSEYEAVRQMYDGVKKLIEMEKAAGN